MWTLPDDLLCVIGNDGRIKMVNPAWRRTLNWSDGDLIGVDPLDFVEPEDANAITGALREARRAGRFEQMEVRCRHADGSHRWLSWSGHRAKGEWYVIAKDVTALRSAESELAHRERHSRALLRALGDGLCVVDGAGRIREVSERFCQMTGFAEHELIGAAPPYPCWPEEEHERIGRAFNAALHTAASHHDLTFQRKDGERFPVWIEVSALAERNGNAELGFLAVVRDVSREIREMQAARDYLRTITDSMGEGLFTLDTDGRLIYINPAGEELLGWRQDELIGEVMHEMTHHRRADGSPWSLEECPLLHVRSEGEVVRVDDDLFVRKDGSELPVEITAAPFRTEEGVRGTVVVFSDISERKTRERHLRAQVEASSWVGRVREALSADRFVLHAQPIIDIASGKTAQHELLIRLRDRSGAIVLPHEFLPAAEASGLIVDIDRWVVRQAITLASAGHAVELNLSARSLAAPGLIDDIHSELERSSADPSLIVVELTETALLSDEPAAELFIERVAALGCGLALDDFGTGYGGFTYLKRLPVNFLKIDIEFVRDLPINEASQHVVKAIVSLAHGFGQQTVAEGVEDEATLRMLHDFGVDYGQGYGIARPGPVTEVLGRS
jgi:PAS domain S-box-containing protein